jgi:hypothetical protein
MRASPIRESPTRESKCVHDGTCYPANHVCAKFDEKADAKAAVGALQTAGFTDVEWFQGAQAYEAIQDRSGQENVLLRIWRQIRDVGTEGDLHRLYLATLRAGGALVTVYAHPHERVEVARAILAAHHAQSIWYLGAWAMERLPAAAPK